MLFRSQQNHYNRIAIVKPPKSGRKFTTARDLARYMLCGIAWFPDDGTVETITFWGHSLAPNNSTPQPAHPQLTREESTMHWNEIKLCTACIFLSGLTAIAQKPDDPPAGTQDSKAPSRSTNTFPPAQTSAADIAGEQVLQGCVSLQGGRYVVQRSAGETVTPTSEQDLSAHVGHTVALHGNYASADPEAGRPPNSSATSPESSEQSSPKFVVTKIEMVSETCSIDKRNPGSKPTSPKSN